MAVDALSPRLSPRLARLRRIGLISRDDRNPDPVRGIDRPMMVLLGAMVLWIAVFEYLVYQRHANFGTFDFDLGIYDQAVWIMNHHGQGTITVRGLPAFGHHINPAFWLLAPFSWFGAGPQFLDFIQVLSLAAPALILFLIGRDRMRSGWWALPFGLAWLLHPSVQLLVWETFHPDTMGIVWVLAAYLAASRGKWRWYWVCLVIAMGWKEEYALAVLMLGLVMMLWGRRRNGIKTLLLGSGWFIAATNILQPILNGHRNHAGTFYGSLGTSMGQVAVNSVKHPGEVLSRLNDHHAESYLRHIGEPFGFTSLLSPVNLIVAVPQLFINLLATAGFIYDPQYHYVAIPLIAAALAMVEGVSRLRARRIRAIAVAAILVCAVMATITTGNSPIGARYSRAYWALDSSRRSALEGAMALVGSNDNVVATYNFVPHLTHRDRIYTFPNPWIASNWGVDGEDPDSPDGIKWLLIDTTTFSEIHPEVKALFEQLIDTGGYHVVYDREGVIAATNQPTA